MSILACWTCAPLYCIVSRCRIMKLKLVVNFILWLILYWVHSLVNILKTVVTNLMTTKYFFLFVTPTNVNSNRVSLSDLFLIMNI